MALQLAVAYFVAMLSNSKSALQAPHDLGQKTLIRSYPYSAKSPHTGLFGEGFGGRCGLPGLPGFPGLTGRSFE